MADDGGQVQALEEEIQTLKTKVKKQKKDIRSAEQRAERARKEKVELTHALEREKAAREEAEAALETLREETAAQQQQQQQQQEQEQEQQVIRPDAPPTPSRCAVTLRRPALEAELEALVALQLQQNQEIERWLAAHHATVATTATSCASSTTGAPAVVARRDDIVAAAAGELAHVEPAAALAHLDDPGSPTQQLLELTAALESGVDIVARVHTDASPAQAVRHAVVVPCPVAARVYVPDAPCANSSSQTHLHRSHSTTTLDDTHTLQTAHGDSTMVDSTATSTRSSRSASASVGTTRSGSAMGGNVQLRCDDDAQTARSSSGQGACLALDPHHTHPHPAHGSRPIPIDSRGEPADVTAAAAVGPCGLGGRLQSHSAPTVVALRDPMCDADGEMELVYDEGRVTHSASPPRATLEERLGEHHSDEATAAATARDVGTDTTACPATAPPAAHHVHRTSRMVGGKLVPPPLTGLGGHVGDADVLGTAAPRGSPRVCGSSRASDSVPSSEDGTECDNSTTATSGTTGTAQQSQGANANAAAAAVTALDTVVIDAPADDADGGVSSSPGGGIVDSLHTAAAYWRERLSPAAGMLLLPQKGGAGSGSIDWKEKFSQTHTALAATQRELEAVRLALQRHEEQAQQLAPTRATVAVLEQQLHRLQVQQRRTSGEIAMWIKAAGDWEFKHDLVEGRLLKSQELCDVRGKELDYVRGRLSACEQQQQTDGVQNRELVVKLRREHKDDVRRLTHAVSQLQQQQSVVREEAACMSDVLREKDHQLSASLESIADCEAQLHSLGEALQLTQRAHADTVLRLEQEAAARQSVVDELSAGLAEARAAAASLEVQLKEEGERKSALAIELDAWQRRWNVAAATGRYPSPSPVRRRAAAPQPTQKSTRRTLVYDDAVEQAGVQRLHLGSEVEALKTAHAVELAVELAAELRQMKGVVAEQTRRADAAERQLRATTTSDGGVNADGTPSREVAPTHAAPGTRSPAARVASPAGGEAEGGAVDGAVSSAEAKRRALAELELMWDLVVEHRSTPFRAASPAAVAGTHEEQKQGDDDDEECGKGSTCAPEGPATPSPAPTPAGLSAVDDSAHAVDARDEDTHDGSRCGNEDNDDEDDDDDDDDNVDESINTGAVARRCEGGVANAGTSSCAGVVVAATLVEEAVARDAAAHEDSSAAAAAVVLAPGAVAAEEEAGAGGVYPLAASGCFVVLADNASESGASSGGDATTTDGAGAMRVRNDESGAGTGVNEEAVLMKSAVAGKMDAGGHSPLSIEREPLEDKAVCVLRESMRGAVEGACAAAAVEALGRQVECLERQLDAARNDLEYERRRRARADDETETLRRQLDASAGAATTLQQQLLTSTHDLVASQHDLTVTHAELRAQHEEVARYKVAVEALERRVTTLQKQLASATRAYEVQRLRHHSVVP